MLIQILIFSGGALLAILVGVILLIAKTHKKVPQGRAIIRIGFGGTKVAYDSGIFVVPVLHKMEEMDISLKTIEVTRVWVLTDLYGKTICAPISKLSFLFV